MTRQNNGSAVAFGGAPQSGIARVASCRFRTTFGSNHDADDLDRIQSE
jgi:hypothetical protein